MLNTHACSTFSLKKYPHQERGRIIRQITSLNTNRGGYVVPFQVPMNQVHIIWNGRHAKQSYGYCSPRFSALANNQENIENLPLEQHKLGHDYMPKPEDSHQINIWTSISKQLIGLYQFLNPSIIFFVAQTTSISFVSVETVADLSMKFFMELLKANVVTLLVTIYVFGMNQLFDIEIDKVNKPYLPLASGEISIEFLAAITLTSIVLSFAIGLMSQSLWLQCGVLFPFLYGTIYAVDIPFLRWKKYPLRALLISVVFGNGLGLTVPYFVHFQKFVLGKPMVFTKSSIFLFAMMSLISAFLGIVKDVPDVDGDRENGIDTFAIRFGEERVFSFSVNMMLMGYGLAMMIGATSSSIASKLVTVLGHLTLAITLWVRAKATDVTNKFSAKSFDKFIWKLFYAELLLLPFVH